MVKVDNDGKTASGLVTGMSEVKSAGAILEAGGTRRKKKEARTFIKLKCRGRRRIRQDLSRRQGV